MFWATWSAKAQNIFLFKIHLDSIPLVQSLSCAFIHTLLPPALQCLSLLSNWNIWGGRKQDFLYHARVYFTLEFWLFLWRDVPVCFPDCGTLVSQKFQHPSQKTSSERSWGSFWKTLPTLTDPEFINKHGCSVQKQEVKAMHYYLKWQLRVVLLPLIQSHW